MRPAVALEIMIAGAGTIVMGMIPDYQPAKPEIVHAR
jgi:hypothetical protein